MSGGVSQRKQNYYKRILDMLAKHSQILVVVADNVGSAHMQSIRKDIRGQATLLMGKNTIMRKAMREYAIDHPEIEPLMNKVYGNVGLVFINGDLGAVRESIIGNKVGAFAKIGSVSPCDVIVPKGNTGMDPGKTSFFQALSIQTKINRGKIEIINDIHLIKPGEKVSSSQAVLLQMLDIKPFEYGLKITTVYDNGSVFSPEILDLTDDDILNKFKSGVSRIAALGLSVGYPTIASVPHSISNGYRNLIALSVATAYTFKGSEEIKRLLEDPEALAALQAASAAPATGGGGGEGGEGGEGEGGDKDDEDSDMEGGMGGLFGGSDSDDEEGGLGGMFGGSDSD